MCNAFLPALEAEAGDDPGLFAADAASRQVAQSIEDTIAILGEGERGRLRLFLKLLNQPLFIAFHGRASKFSALSRADAERVLLSLGSSRLAELRSGFQAVRRLATFHYYSAGNGESPDPVWTGIGYAPSSNPPAAPSALELTSITGDTTLECDACVIGSGAGGGVAAAKLAAAGMNVIVLEAASDWQSADFDQREEPGTRELYLDRGTTATRDLSLSLLAGASIGGGTTVNWQTSLRTPASVRAEWAASSGCEHFVDESFSASLDAVCGRIAVSAAESVVNPNNATLRDGCSALGYDWSPIERNSVGCDVQQCGNCVYGCRHGGKQSTGVTYLVDAQASGARTVARCQATRLVIENGRVKGVEATVTSNAARHTLRVKAGIVVAACGSLHTPALLMRSGVRLPHIGKNLHLHPTTGVGALFSHRIAAWEGPPQTIVCNEFASLRDGYGFRIETAPAHPGLLALATPWTGGRDHRRQMQSSARKALLIVLVRDRSTGTVSIDRQGRPQIDYRPGAGEQAMLREGMVQAARIFNAAGAEAIQTLHTEPLSVGIAGESEKGHLPDIESFCQAIARARAGENHLGVFSAHQMGTCRMGTNPSSAVCNEKGEVFGVGGLFIADASAFPGSCGVNPMITIMALAHHTASRIAD
ncbi:MAG TPA: GMC family oxidoreductase [Gemmatimonadaceae bacterium]|nr:GMC family oxidoreductase [Gemmatimonadaceae bacterium]